MKNFDKYTKKNLEELLLEHNLVNQKKLRELFLKSEQKKIPIEKILIDHALLDEDKLVELTCKHFSLPYISLNQLNINGSLVKEFTTNMMKKYLFFPIEKRGDALTLVICAPPRPEMLKEVSLVKSCDIFFFIDCMSNVEKYINEYSSMDEASSHSAGNTDVWQTMFEKADDQIMSEILVRTQERSESPLQRTLNRKDSPINREIDSAVSSIFPEEPPMNDDDDDDDSGIDSSLSAIFGDDKPKKKPDDLGIDSSLSAIFGDDEPEDNSNDLGIDSSLSAIFGDEEPMQKDNSSYARKRMAELSFHLEQNALDKEAISEYVQLAISNNKVDDGIEKLSNYARLLIRNKHYDEAKKAYESILALDCDNEEAQNYLSS